MDKIIEMDERYGAHLFSPLPVVLTRGQGVWAWDLQGKKYLDMTSAASALSFGHCHPKLVAALQEQASRLTLTTRVFYTDKVAPFLKKLCEVTGMDSAIPMNTGAEAVETALKAIRLWGYQKKGIERDKAEIIVVENNFHGRTNAVISFSSVKEYKEGFGPYMPGFKMVPFGAVKELEEAITPRTAGFLVEPMQGEAGVIIPPRGWLTEASRICKKHHVLFILDEIQTGLGRTGKRFAFEHEGISPDGMILGKALGGGILPVSAFVAKREIMDLFTPGSHGSTFGGNPLAMAVGLEALKVMEEENLPERSAVLGEYFLQQMQRISSPLIKDVRGKGLWIGVEFDPDKISGKAVCEYLVNKGVLVKETRKKIIRFAPPLIISKEEIDFALSKFSEAMHELLRKYA